MARHPGRVEIPAWNVSEGGPGAQQQNTFRWLTETRAEQVISLILMR